MKRPPRLRQPSRYVRRHLRRWSDADNKLLRTLRAEGTPVIVMAFKLGRTNGAVVEQIRAQRKMEKNL